MSAVRTKEVLLSPDEYIAGELLSEVRHEYLAGRTYERSESSVEHNHIAGNFFGELGVHLRGKQSQPFAVDMKVRIQTESDDSFYYPDVMVNCDPAGQHRYFCDTPALIVEVLSPDTERTDRREKRFAYQRLASLHTYVLIAQEQREVTVYHRLADGWEKTILTGNDTPLVVPELEFSVALDTLYARTGL